MAACELGSRVVPSYCYCGRQTVEGKRAVLSTLTTPGLFLAQNHFGFCWLAMLVPNCQALCMVLQYCHVFKPQAQTLMLAG